MRLGFMNGESEGCWREEREALMRLKEAFNYPNSNSLASWNNLTSTFSADCCSWDGVYCDNSTHRVISLDLSYKRAEELKWSLNASSFLPFLTLKELYLQGNYLSGLSGNIKLPNLEFLFLEDNKLTQFPSFDFSHSRNLKALALADNLLEGSILESITSLTSLTLLSLGGNYLNGSLPQEGGLCNLKNLLLLDLEDNEFEGQLPACPTKLTSLRTLRIAGNHFEGSFPSSLLHSMTSLIAITLSDDNFNNGSFSFSLLANHSYLKIIEIYCFDANLKLETENPPFIPSFQLRIFSLYNCTLNEANNHKMPTFLLHQHDLLYLRLAYTNISGTFPSWLLTNNTKLSYFNLTHNLFTAPFELNSPTKLLYMETFDISSNPIGDVMPSHIGFIFPNLISLDMFLTLLRGFFPSSIAEMGQLNDLDLSNNNLTGDLPQGFGQRNNTRAFLAIL